MNAAYSGLILAISVSITAVVLSPVSVWLLVSFDAFSSVSKLIPQKPTQPT